MKELILKHKTIVIILAAIIIAAIGFGAGMMMHTSMAQGGGSYITAEEAKTIALENVGVSPSKATFTKAELDKDNGTDLYEIEFYSGVNEYEFEINAKTGEILEKKSEARSDLAQTAPDASGQPAPSPDSQSSSAGESSQPAGSSTDSQGYIGIDRAKTIALKHAGINASDAVFTKAKLDSDDGIKTYEIEFYCGNREYEYEINAHTGDLLDASSEYMDDYTHHSENHHSLNSLTTHNGYGYGYGYGYGCGHGYGQGYGCRQNI